MTSQPRLHSRHGRWAPKARALGRRGRLRTRATSGGDDPNARPSRPTRDGSQVDSGQSSVVADDLAEAWRSLSRQASAALESLPPSSGSPTNEEPPTAAHEEVGPVHSRHSRPDADVVSVPREKCLQISDKAVYALAKAALPAEHWQAVSHTLARVETLLHVQLMHAADMASATLTLSNTAPVLPAGLELPEVPWASLDERPPPAGIPTTTGRRTTGHPPSGAQGRSAAPWSARPGGCSRETVFPAPSATTQGSPHNAEGGAAAAAWRAPQPGLQVAEAAAGLSERQLSMAASGEAGSHLARVRWFQQRVSRGPLTAAEARRLDELLVLQILALAEQAHFTGLCARDVALGRSLNDDKLSQLFVRVDASTLDDQLADAHVDRGLPEDSRGALVLKRGTGYEARTGLLLVPKLDYLQLEAVQFVSDSLRWLWAGFLHALEDLSTLDYDPAGDEEVGPMRGQAGSETPGGALDGAAPRLRTAAAGSSPDARIARSISRRGRDVSVAMAAWGISPRTVGGGLLLTLSDLGVGPNLGVILLERFDRVWPAPDASPVRLQRVTLKHTLRAQHSPTSTPGWAAAMQRFLQATTLTEPTYQEIAVVFRRLTPLPAQPLQRLRSALQRVWQRVRSRWLPPTRQPADRPPREGPAQPASPPAARERIQLRVLSNIPIAYWPAVFPDKLLQFKPLDGLRVDLISVVGALAAVARFQITSPLLEALSLASLTVVVVRSVLSYRRMNERYENFVNDMIATKTLAQDAAVLELLAKAAAQQRFRSSALAYVCLVQHAAPWLAELDACSKAAAAARAAGDPEGLRVVARMAQQLVEAQPWLEAAATQPQNLVSWPLDSEAEAWAAGSAAQAVGGGHMGAGGNEAARANSDRSAAGRAGAGGRSQPGLTCEELQALVDEQLAHAGHADAVFDAAAVLGDLQRLGLVEEEGAVATRWLQCTAPAGTAPAAMGADEDSWAGAAPGCDPNVRWVPVMVDAEAKLDAQWAQLLRESVDVHLLAAV